MKPFSCSAGACALGLLLALSGPLEAAWNNVFQVTCGCRHRRPTTAAFVQVPAVAAAPAAPCCDPCPQPVCTTRYIQRCYYQPVTSYTTKTYYEPVTTYQTKYFYEPVTSYRYTCAYDPCTGCPQQVATPVTSYQLRSQCCPVQSWVQRCCSVPVTTYQRVSYWEPQTTCCDPCAARAPVAAAVVPAPVVPGQPPAILEQQRQTPPPPMINEGRSGNGNGAAPFQQDYRPPFNGPGSSFRPPVGGPVPVQPVSPPPPAVKVDRIAFATSARVDGQVVRLDRTPRAGAQVMFISAQRQAPHQTVTANSAGQFQVNLASGSWLVYVNGSDGRQVFHSRIEVDGKQTPLTVVAR